MIIQLNPAIRMNTPKGPGYANFLIDRGMDLDNEWIVFLDNTEIWSFLNDKVRVDKNYTYNREEATRPSQAHSEAIRNYIQASF